ncbi:hypothetical protein M758_11G016300 [Ceratodon purpureus]|nr:hypothetical protein M758_11G016300 [Ceratodon purpureus]
MSPPPVPALFKCPISLELMRDPVVLCTGQTYDRCSIEPWLRAGNTTCPATMLQLESLEIVPNLTLRRLIQEWISRHSRGGEDVATREHQSGTIKVQVVDPRELSGLLRDVAHCTSGYSKLSTLKKLRCFVREGERNQRYVRDAGGVAVITAYLASIIGDDEEVCEACEEALAVLVSLVPHSGFGELQGLVGGGGVVVASMTTVLCKGSLESRVNVATIIAAIAAHQRELHFDGAAKAFNSFTKLLREDLYPKALKSSLRALLALCRARHSRTLAVQAGVVPALIELLPELQKANAERALAILDLMCATPDGRAAMMDHDLVMPVFVSQFHTISATATEYIVSILWSLCQASKESLAAAQEAGVFAPLLLLLQIECAPKTRQKCGELLKQVKSGWKEISCDPHFFLPFITAM